VLCPLPCSSRKRSEAALLGRVTEHQGDLAEQGGVRGERAQAVGRATEERELPRLQIGIGG